MKIRKSLGIVLMCFFLWMNQISYAREDLDHVNVLQEKQNQIQTEQNVRASGRESGRSTGDDGTNYPIQLSNNYHYGEQKISLEWTGVSDGTSLVDKAKVGDYIDYSIDEQTLEDNLKALPRRIRNSTDLTLNRTKWKVLRNDGKTIEIISTNPVARTQVSGQDYGWYEANPYGIGDYEGDHGGYGYYYQLNQIANSFSDKNFVQKSRPLDFKDLDRSQELVQLQKYLGQEDAEQINIIIREGGFDEITDTQKHGDFLGIDGHRNYDAVVGNMDDPEEIYTDDSPFFLPNYYNTEISAKKGKTDTLNAVYYVDGQEIKLHRTYPKGKSMTAGIKVILTLKDGLYQIGGDGSYQNPWKMGTNPKGATYTVYQKVENGSYEEKTKTDKQNLTLTQADGLYDMAAPDRPNAELHLIRGDSWNLRLDVKAGDNGTQYFHQVVAKTAKGELISNETTSVIATGVAGFSYAINNDPNFDPGNDINYQVDGWAKVDRILVNKGNYIHIKTIDYVGNESDILHMPLNFEFRDLNLFKTYQEASDFDDYGIAHTPGWNYVNIDWNPIHEGEGTVIVGDIPEICFVIDRSGSMSGKRLSQVKNGATVLINKLFDKYPTIKMSVVTFETRVQTLLVSSNDRNQLINTINNIETDDMTNAGGGIQRGTDLLLNSTQANRILLCMTDGYSNEGPNPNDMIDRAKQNGIKVISMLIDTSAGGQFTNSDAMYQVSSSQVYDTIAKDFFTQIEEVIVSKYNAYRDEAGVNQYQLVKKETTDVNYGDGEATDKAGPNRPIVTLSDTGDHSGKIQMKVWAEDRGTSYEFYVQLVHSRTQKELTSNPTVQEVKTGVRGYAWTVDDNPTTDPGGNIRDLQLTFGPESVGKWLHIRAVDWAGNWGDVCHVRIETSRYIPWEDLNSKKELFCVQHGQTIPAREDGTHLNAKVVAGSGKYKIDEVVADPKTGDRIGTRFVEGTTQNVYGTQDIYSYSLGKYHISPDTPPKRPGKEGNATDQEAYILNYYQQNNSLESFVQKAMYATEISKGNVTWNWESTLESEALLAEANAYAAYKQKGYEFSNVKMDSEVLTDEDYQDVYLGPFVLKYEPQAFKNGNREVYFASIVGMKVYDQNDQVIAEFDQNGNNIGKVKAEIIYSKTTIPEKRKEAMFTKEKYKFPVGDEEFYIKFYHSDALDQVSKINKVEFIHNEYNADAQYNVMVGTYNKVKWTPNRITQYDKDVLWCHETDNGYNTCIHGKNYSHIVGCYFYLTATVYQSYRDIPSQKLIDVLWAKNNTETKIQTLTKGSGNDDPNYPPDPGKKDDETNDEWKLKMNISGNIWNDGMEDQNNGLKEKGETGIEKVKVNLYQVDKNNKRTGKNYTTYSDAVGNYQLSEVMRGMYEIEFVYDGQHYKSSKMLVNGSVADYKTDYTHKKYSNNSVTEEVTSQRDAYNEKFTEIAGNDTAIGNKGKIGLSYDTDRNVSKIQTTDDNGYTKPEFEMASRTSSYDLYFPVSRRETVSKQSLIKIVDSENVNFGLTNRYLTDMSLKTDLYQTIFSIKGNVQSYIFSERNIRDISSNIEKDAYIQKVNRADYNWKIEDVLNKAPDEETRNRLLEILGSAEQSELEGYLDYMIVIRNAGEKDEAQIAELADYYTKDLAYADQYRDFDVSSWAQVKYETVNEEKYRDKTDKFALHWTEKSKYDNVDNPYKDQYNKMYTTDLDRPELRVKKGEYLEIHIIFKTNKNAEGKLSLDENGSGKSSMTEINGYKTYYQADGKIAGLIDTDSKPGNANPTKDKSLYEDDEDKSPSLQLLLDDSNNGGDSMDDQDDVKKDENGKPVGYGNVVEGNVWDDDRTGENVKKLANNQIISDGIRQDNEKLIQDVQVDLVEYFKHPTDSSKDVYLTLKTQKTRAVLSLSHDQKLEGGYSFINLPSGHYQTQYTYGNAEQLQQNLQYNGQDYQGIATRDIDNKSEVKRSYGDVEIMLVADASSSMDQHGIEKVKELAEKTATHLYDQLPGVKIGLTEFSRTAQVLLEPRTKNNNLIKKIQNLENGVREWYGSTTENLRDATAIGYGLDQAIQGYTSDAKKKIMLVLTDSEENVQQIEQVIKQLERASDDNEISVKTILTKNHDDIFGTEAQPRRGTVYAIDHADTEDLVQQICQEIQEESQLESNRSGSKDLEGDANTPGTRAYNIAQYETMDLKKAQRLDITSIEKMTGDEKQKAIQELADSTYMKAVSKMVSFKANQIKHSDIHELNLALMKRPMTKLTMETKVVGVKVILPDNKVIIDTAKGVNKNVLGIDKEELPITIYMDEEIMHGATLQVQYETTIRNEGEVDTLSNYLSSHTDQDTVTTSAKIVFNYTSKNMLYKDDNHNTWTVVSRSAITDQITQEAKDKIRKEDLQSYQTEDFGIELYPPDSMEVKTGKGSSEAKFITTLSKLMTSENNELDLTFDSSMEIVQRRNTAGRRAEQEIPGDYIPNTEPTQRDATRTRRIVVTKPWGENKSVAYVLIVISVLVVLAGAIAGWKWNQQKKKK